MMLKGAEDVFASFFELQDRRKAGWVVDLGSGVDDGYGRVWNGWDLVGDWRVW